MGPKRGPRFAVGVRLTDRAYQARVAALSIAHSSTMLSLLRAHGHDEHADNLEAAIAAVVAIVSKSTGKENLTEALEWVSGEANDGSEFLASVLARH